MNGRATHSIARTATLPDREPAHTQRGSHVRSCAHFHVARVSLTVTPRYVSSLPPYMEARMCAGSGIRVTYYLTRFFSGCTWICTGLGSGSPGTRRVVITSTYHSLLGASAADSAEKGSFLTGLLALAGLLRLLSSLPFFGLERWDDGGVGLLRWEDGGVALLPSPCFASFVAFASPVATAFVASAGVSLVGCRSSSFGCDDAVLCPSDDELVEPDAAVSPSSRRVPLPRRLRRHGFWRRWCCAALPVTLAAALAAAA